MCSQAINDDTYSMRAFGSLDLHVLDNDIGVGTADFQIVTTTVDVGNLGTVELINGEYYRFTPNTGAYGSQTRTDVTFAYTISNRWLQSTATVKIEVRRGLICNSLPDCTPEKRNRTPVCVGGGGDTCQLKSNMNGNNDLMQSNDHCGCCGSQVHRPNLCCAPLLGCFSECCYPI